MSRLSILIPWRENNSLFEGTLVSILANRPTNSEVIVVHRGTYDDPYDLGREVLFVEHDHEAQLADLVNRGLEVAGGEVLHLIACGVTVDEGWSDGVREVFAADPALGAIIPLVVSAESPQRVVNSGVSLSMTGSRTVVGSGRSVQRPATNAWGPSILAGFYRLPAVRALGGFAHCVGEAADIDLAGSLLQADYDISTAPECQLVYHGEQPHDESTSLEKCCHSERLYWRHRSLLPAGNLLAHAAKNALALPLSLIAGHGFRPLGQRLAASMERKDYRQHQTVIAEAMYDEHDKHDEHDEGATVLSINRSVGSESYGSRRAA